MEADLGDKASLTKVFGPRCNTGGEAKDLHTLPLLLRFSGAAMLLYRLSLAPMPWSSLQCTPLPHQRSSMARMRVDAAKEVCGMCQHT